MLPEYLAACDYLRNSRKFGQKLGLETMGQLVEALGHPERRLKFIHIAGTNGKGSVAAFCSAVLEEAGFRVGLFTSPHLCSLRERIRIQGCMISPADFATGMQVIQERAQQLEVSPTFFEILTALSLWYFERHSVDYVVWETGLGGRLDATNVVTPLVSVISSIAIDHTQFLGDTLAKIAAEKAGIIKSGVPVVTAVTERESLRVIENVANERGSRLTKVGLELPFEVLSLMPERVLAKIDNHTFTLSLPGMHQAANAACAYAALSTLLLDGQPLPLNVVRRGFARAHWPGRFQLLRGSPPLLVDGAHNLAAVQVLLQSWKEAFGNYPYHLVFGALTDKPFAEMAKMLARGAARVTLVGVPSERSVSPEIIRPYFDDLPVRISPHLHEIWPALQQDSGAVLITGSLFLVGQALSLAKPEDFPPEDFALNERLT